MVWRCTDSTDSRRVQGCGEVAWLPFLDILCNMVHRRLYMVHLLSPYVKKHKIIDRRSKKDVTHEIFAPHRYTVVYLLCIYDAQPSFFTSLHRRCTMYNRRCTMYNRRCTMYNRRCTMYNRRCTMYNRRCTMYNHVVLHLRLCT